jgi:hypothetical protein
LDKVIIGDDALKNLTKLFSKFGWNKKLSELTEEEITSTVLIMQFSKRIKEDEQYTKQYLDKLLLKYVHEKEEETIRDEDLPF